MWTIQLLGGLAARRSQQEVTRFRTQKSAALLAYLAFHAAPPSLPQPRDVLIGMLWPDDEPEAGRNNLSKALSFLRRVLEPPGVPPGTVILADRASVRLNPAALTSDVFQFESALRRAVREALSEGDRLALRIEAAELYHGPLLPGFYEEWITPEATRLSSLFIELAGQVVAPLLAAGRMQDALSLAERAVQADALSEAATRHLMRVLGAMQQPSQALRAYRQLEARLRKELEEAPSASLQAYARELRAAFSSALPAAGAAGPGQPQPDAIAAPTPEAGTPWVGALEGGTHEEARPSERLRGSEFLLLTTTRFFDREREIARLSAMLSTPRTRLVTLTGTAGTGKTRLALELAARLVEAPAGDAPGSAVFVPLADVQEPGRLFEVILRVLGVPPTPGQDPGDQLGAVLASRPGTLLILDNFEQLVEEGAVRVRDLLARSGVKLLVTSRQKLRIEGEHEFRLAPLPTSSSAPTPEALLGTPGIALFVDRAQAARSDFQLTERNAAGVGQLCERLEGLPLAIELAAARVSVLSPARILEQVSAGRLDFLGTRRRDAASRQRTLRATLDWSYLLLPEAARQFLAELSVFRGGWTLEAAQAVCETNEDDEVLDLLMHLRDSSLITAVDEEDGLRFHLLETVREYAADHLKRSGAQAEVQRRHAAYFLELAEASTASLHGPDLAARAGALWARLEREHDNFRAALGWARAAGEDQLRAELGCSLSRFWLLEGYLEEVRQWLEELGAKAETVSLSSRARPLNALGIYLASRGAYTTARGLFETSLAVERALGNRTEIAWTVYQLGHLASEQGDDEMARRLFDEGLEIFRELADPSGTAASLAGLGNVALRQGDHEAAQSFHEAGLALSRELGDRVSVAIALNNLGKIARERGDARAAWALHAESLTIRRELGDKGGFPWSLEAFAQLCAPVAPEHAARLCGAADALRESLGLPLPPGEREEHDRAISVVREALGPERFAAAWAAGRELTLEEAVRCAMETQET